MVGWLALEAWSILICLSLISTGEILWSVWLIQTHSHSDCFYLHITSYIFYPIAWLMGVPTEDCFNVASLIGTKIIVNEFAAYAQLGKLIEEDNISPRATTISTFALCGFSNLGSIGIQSAVIGSLIPHKKRWVTKLVSSACIAGNTACFMT